MPITIEKITNIEGFKNIKDDWNGLLEKCPIKSIFLTWEWLFTWWEHFGADKGLYILLAREADEIIGIAPLMIVAVKRFGMPFRMLRSLGMPDIDVAGFITKDGNSNILANFCKEILAASKNWDICEFGEFPNDIFNPLEIVKNFPEKSYSFRIMPKRHSFIPTNGNWNDYYKSLAKHHRSSLRRKQRLFEDNKIVEYQRFNNGMVKPEHLNFIFNINAKANFPELYATEKLRGFHQALIKPDVLQKAVDFSFLLVNNVPIAFEYGFLFNGVYEAWRGAFEPDFRKFSPGSLIFLALLKNSNQAGHLGVDLLRGEHDYKKRWRGYDRLYTLLWVVPNKNILERAFYIWFPNIKKWLKSHIRTMKNETQNYSETD